MPGPREPRQPREPGPGPGEYRDDYIPPPFAEDTSSKGGGGLGQILISVALAGVLAFVLLTFMAPGKAQYQEDITRLETDLVNIRAEYALKSDIPAAPNLSGYVTTGALAGYALKTDLPSVTGLATTTSVNSADAALEARIEELEAGITPVSTTPSGEISLTVAQGPDQVWTGTDYIYFLQLTNNTGDFRKVYILATASPTGSLVSTYSVDTGSTTPDIPTDDTKFSSNSAHFTLPASTTKAFDTPTFSPAPAVVVGKNVSTNCRMISATTAGYILTGGTASVQIPITFSLRYGTGATMWNVTFTPIVTSY